MTETHSNGNPQESMGVTLSVTQNTEEMESKKATSYSQAGTPMELQRHQPTHKTFDPKFILSTRNAGMGNGTESEGMANQ